MNEQDLLELKKDIDKAKEEKLQLQGQRKTLLSQLLEHGCKTLEEAEKKLKTLQKEIDNISVTIEKGMDEIEENYL
jgi:uncharacterized protein YaaN involved in tellurite resistance